MIIYFCLRKMLKLENVTDSLSSNNYGTVIYQSCTNLDMFSVYSTCYLSPLVNCQINQYYLTEKNYSCAFEMSFILYFMCGALFKVIIS